MPKLSVIVPVYNTESYLRKCLDCFLAQTFRDFEVLLIDDGSTDNSGYICDDYAKSDDRFKVIHKRNGGVSSARNAALKAASGEFIGFVDSDDYFSPFMFQSYVSIIDKYSPDIVFSVGPIDDGDSSNPNIEILNSNQAIDELFILGKIRPSLWLGFFSLKLFRDVEFPTNIHQWEDYAIIAVLLSRASSIAITNQRFYNYVFRDGSATKQPMNDRQMSCLLVDDYLKNNNVYRKKCDRINVVSFFVRCCFVHYVLHTPRSEKYGKLVRNAIADNLFSVIKSHSIGFKTKAMMILFLFSENLTRKICIFFFSKN